jgi:hypothetical protein
VEENESDNIQGGNMAHQWTNEELTKFYEGVNAALKKLLRKINAVDASKVGTAELSEQLSLQSAEVTVTTSDKGIETTVSDLEGRLSSIEQTTDSITLRVESAETTASGAAETAKNAESTITQTAGQIELRVQSAETSAGNAATSASNAESAAGDAATSASNAESAAGDAATSASNAESAAGDAATSASNAATSASEAAASAKNAESTITQLADSITLSVKEGSQKATISLSVNGETQTAEIDLSGLVTFSDLSTEGKTTIYGGNVDTESLFAEAVKATALTLTRSAAGFPTLSLEGKNSTFSISAVTASGANPATVIDASSDLQIQSGAAIILEPGSGQGASGETGVVVEGDLTVNGSISGFLETGTWTPRLYGVSNAYVTYSRQNGWYMKMGNVVVLGWDLYCEFSRTTYTSTILKIRGLPYTPSARCYGGGICTGYYSPSGTPFQGWELGTDGYIYGMGQSYGSSDSIWATTNVYCGTSEMKVGGTIIFTTAS